MLKKILRGLPPPLFNASQWLAYVLTSNAQEQIQSGPAHGLWFNSFRGSAAYLTGANESPVQTFLAEHLKAGDVFYDIGANIGFFTVLGAALVGKTGYVYAFEPLPLNTACIQRNLNLNQFKHVEIIETAVSDSDSTIAIQLTYHPGGATLAGIAIPDDSYMSIEIETLMLDSFLNQPNRRIPTLVKIDVEGAESLVLQGMQDILQNHRPIILYEIDADNASSFQEKQGHCQALLAAARYRIEPLAAAYPDIAHQVGHFAAFPLA